MSKQVLAAMLGVPLFLATLCGAYSHSFNFYVEYWRMPLEKYGVRSPLRWQEVVFIALVWSVLLAFFYISFRLMRYAFPHMRKFSRRHLAVTVCLAIVFVLWLNFLAPAGLPLPFARSPISGNHKFVLFNPFRDRGSERAAQRFFDVIKAGTCGDFDSLARSLTLPNNLTCEQLHVIVSDAKHKGVLDQRLRDRIDKGSSTWLWFSDDGYGGNQVIVEKRGEQWQVVEFWTVW